MASPWATADAKAVAEAGTGTEGAKTVGPAGTPAVAEAVAMAWLAAGLICRQETVSGSRLLPNTGQALG